MKRILITSPIFYPNSDPHIGAAHTLIMCNFIKNFYTTFGFPDNSEKCSVFLSTGTDEHGEKILHESQKVSMTVEEFLKEKRKKFVDLADKLNINYDRFIYTTHPEHITNVIEIWQKLKDLGHIYKGTYTGYYAKSDETFYTESELVNGKAPTGATVELTQEECYFLSLSKAEKKLITFYESKSFIFPEHHMNKVKSFIKDGLRDLCISRKCSWGISIEEDKTIYVWFDALINYLTVSGIEGWQNVIHVIGKDILIFHCVYWPAILILLGLELPTVIVHNWWLVDDHKMSKSTGNVINPMEIIEKFGYLPLVCYLLAENLINNDGNFDLDRMLTYYNDFFINKFCNLVHRVFSFAKKKFLLHLEITKNSFFELSLRENSFDSSAYWRKFFAWCDYLNKKVDEEKIWKDHSNIPHIVGEINNLVFYARVLFSLPSLLEIQENSKLYKRI